MNDLRHCMTSSRDLVGIECDWLAVDSEGHIGLFSTAGGGYVPAVLPTILAAEDAAIDELLAEPPTTRARFAPELGPEYRNTWREAAERGVFAFDSDPNGGPYVLVAAPEAPRLVGEIPKGVREIVLQIRVTTVQFARVTGISAGELDGG